MISIVIPTFDRCESLSMCLDALRAQVVEEDFEVIVVDDGSREPVCETIEKLDWSVVHYLSKEHGGPACARNLGVKKARGDVLVFLDDDVIAGDGFIEAHRLFHEKIVDCACLGYTALDPRIAFTQLMKFLANVGPQFNPELVSDDLSDLPFHYFMTANISIPKKVFRKVGFFDEDFLDAGGEDIEYGFRVREMGHKIVFEKNAIALHNHFMDDEGFRDFCVRKGRALKLFSQKHPDISEIENLMGAAGNHGVSEKIIGGAFTLTAPYLEALRFTPILNMGYFMLFKKYIREGAWETG